MYKFVVISGSCGGAYNLGKAEQAANDMGSKGFELVEAYQTTTSGCINTNPSLVMIFRRTANTQQ